MASREDQLKNWVSQTLVFLKDRNSQKSQEASSVSNFSLQIEMVSGDASFRKYFRLRGIDALGVESLILVDAPPDKEDNPTFVHLARHFLRHHARVPKVYAYDFDQGFMALEDFGDCLLSQLLQTPDDAQHYYPIAIDALVSFQKINPVFGKDSSHTLPSYNRQLLLQEMRLFTDWLLHEHLKIEEEISWIYAVFDQLADEALIQPQVCVHRDYHSRNIMWLPEGEIGLIDFQDAVAGPITYDLVSLLRDCYVKWPNQLVQEWLSYYYHSLPEQIKSNLSIDQLRRWFDWMGVQRHLKASGIFARLYHRDGKSGYLADIPRTLSYIVDIGQQYPELTGLAAFIQSKVLDKL